MKLKLLASLPAVAKSPVWSYAIAFGCLLAVLFLAQRFPSLQTERELDTQGWRVMDFLNHLSKNNIRLHVVPVAADGDLESGVYLTNDSRPTRGELQQKWRTVECVSDWRGIVSVAKTYGEPKEDVDLLIDQWGDHGCRIGDFVIFGDQDIVGRIRKAFIPTESHRRP